MISAWRLSKARYARTAFDGEGARVNGGRWNSIGTRVAYASESIALATLEVLVGLQNTRVLPAYALVGIEFPEELVATLPADRLPPDWQHHPPLPASQRIGDRWIADGRSALLRVPSAVVAAEHNYLLNPRHADFGRVRIRRPRAIELDPRLLGHRSR